jgi:pimeloyl-ACP methyl ester carboxylesterase
LKKLLIISLVFVCGTLSVLAGGTKGAVPSADGVSIAYTAHGSGSPAVVFIHGGYADQSFWKDQVAALADRYQLVTLDLAGHGLSGSDREVWSMAAFGEDVRAVVEALDLDSVILVGNSLGGPVALSAAEKLPGTAHGIIAVDTFQEADQQWSREELEAYIESLREDFPGTCQEMVKQLLLEDTDPDLYAWIESKMCSFDPAVAPRIVEGFLDFDLKEEFAGAEVPIRAIFGQIRPFDLEGNRALRPDFAAVVMEGCGHYPQLERPEEFNRHLVAYVEELR